MYTYIHTLSHTYIADTNIHKYMHTCAHKQTRENKKPERKGATNKRQANAKRK